MPGRSRSSTTTSYRVTVAFSCPSAPSYATSTARPSRRSPRATASASARLVLHHQHPHASSLPDPASAPGPGSAGTDRRAGVPELTADACYSIVTANVDRVAPRCLLPVRARGYVVAHNNCRQARWWPASTDPVHGPGSGPAAVTRPAARKGPHPCASVTSGRWRRSPPPPSLLSACGDDSGSTAAGGGGGGSSRRQGRRDPAGRGDLAALGGQRPAAAQGRVRRRRHRVRHPERERRQVEVRHDLRRHDQRRRQRAADRQPGLRLRHGLPEEGAGRRHQDHRLRPADPRRRGVATTSRSTTWRSAS